MDEQTEDLQETFKTTDGVILETKKKHNCILKKN